MTPIYTITTGQGYKYGVFALINSLRQLGVQNPVIVGTDAPLPELDQIEGVSQVIVGIDWNGTNLKAYTILNRPDERFIYLDSDVIVTDKSFIGEIEKLLDEGKWVAPVDGIVLENEYRRSFWRSIYPFEGKVRHSWYYNAGFFAGVMKIHRQLLEDWIELNKKYLDLKAFLFDNHRLPMADQDTLNAILQSLSPEDMATIQMPDWRSISMHDHPFYLIGNFRPHAFLHCTGKIKPWNIKGIPPRSPNTYDDFWYKYMFKDNSPVKSDFKLTFWEKQWFERSLLSRIVIKLKKIAR